MISFKIGLGVLFGLLVAGANANAAQLTACASAVTNCPNDTTNDQGLLIAVEDYNVQVRVFNLWNAQCANVYSEASTTVGHSFRVGKCQDIAAGRVPRDVLVSLILSSIVQTQILDGQGSPANSYQPAGGNMVDADVNTAIGTALTVTQVGGTSVTTTGTQATVPSNNLVVNSATGIVPGMSVYAAGVAPTTTVAFVNGTTVFLSGNNVTTAMSAAAVSFVAPTAFYGFPTR